VSYTGSVFIPNITHPAPNFSSDIAIQVKDKEKYHMAATLVLVDPI
jgi:hypothetical protein